jgi:hypothetical protein
MKREKKRLEKRGREMKVRKTNRNGKGERHYWKERNRERSGEPKRENGEERTGRKEGQRKRT